MGAVDRLLKNHELFHTVPSISSPNLTPEIILH